MKYLIILSVLIIASSCSRPETPPSSPLQPPTVQAVSTPSTDPLP